MPTGSKLLSLKSSLDSPERVNHIIWFPPQVSILPEELALGIGRVHSKEDVTLEEGAPLGASPTLLSDDSGRSRGLCIRAPQIFWQIKGLN